MSENKNINQENQQKPGLVLWFDTRHITSLQNRNYTEAQLFMDNIITSIFRKCKVINLACGRSSFHYLNQ
jgi:hypothetical protein